MGKAVEMFLHYGLFICASTTFFVFLKWQTIATNLCLFVAAGILAYNVTVAARTFLPRRLLPRLHEKAILITGCDTGFGNQLARSLDSLGVTVYAGCFLPDGPDAQELKKSSSETLHILPLDVTKDENVEAALQYVKSTLGDKKLWAVVNNAGTATMGEIEWIPMQVLKDIFEVNTFGPIRVTNAFLPLLRQSKGRVVNLISFSIHLPVPFLIPYVLAKSATSHVTRGQGIELKKFSISTHAIEPCLFRTAIVETFLSSLTRNWNNTSNELKEEYGKDYPQYVQGKFIKIVNQFGHSKRKMYLVVNDMLDACIGISPKDSYIPGYFGNLSLFLIKCTPTRLLNYLVALATQPTKFQPK